ncbi:hypothetical protein PR202_ga12558 [Eleusine coracana subsp. coracana]|uniref:Uncharacterized protein n=1 Tax=Eleusine coracana subsp. coracana TaxID=191504 RepID=A0AAV5CCF7_ELECO|nr:hypothetical protein PR202_ga12558 [Eleusine coracana subsp. coracana]
MAVATRDPLRVALTVAPPERRQSSPEASPPGPSCTGDWLRVHVSVEQTEAHTWNRFMRGEAHWKVVDGEGRRKEKVRRHRVIGTGQQIVRHLILQLHGGDVKTIIELVDTKGNREVELVDAEVRKSTGVDRSWGKQQMRANC